MPRCRRIVFPGVPHHVTQRGNRREQVFFCDADRTAYLAWLHQYSLEHEIEILAYCLMPNHVHLVAVPRQEDALHRALKPLHMRYAQRVNRMRGWKGHVWQGRYFAAALDESHLWAAVRYVERNPVRAGLIAAAECYEWSSASGHCGRWSDPLLSTDPAWLARVHRIGDWSRWLGAGDDQRTLDALRASTAKGLPCGANAFIERLEAHAGCSLSRRPLGRPAKCPKPTAVADDEGCVPF